MVRESLRRDPRPPVAGVLRLGDRDGLGRWHQNARLCKAAACGSVSPGSKEPHLSGVDAVIRVIDRDRAGCQVEVRLAE